MSLRIFDHLSRLVFSQSPRVVRSPHPARWHGKENERRHALGIGRREKHRHRAVRAGSEQGRALRPDRIQDGAHIVHSLLERRNATRPIGQSDATTVEEKQAGERRQLAHEARPTRVLPEDLDVGYDLWDEDQVERTLTDDLIRDVQTVGRARIADRRNVHRR